MEKMLSIIIPAVLSIVGWFIVDYFNRKVRTEEANRAAYYKLFDELLSHMNEIVMYQNRIYDASRNLETILSKKGEKSKADLEAWSSYIHIIIESAYKLKMSILGYMRIMKYGGIIDEAGKRVYKALESIVYDANKALNRIGDNWLGYTNFNEMNVNQVERIKAEMHEDMGAVYELMSCLEDILAIEYNKYISKPLGKDEAEIDFSEKRRYITTEGIVDKRQ